MTDLVGPGAPGAAPCPGTTRGYALDVVIPVHNEERDLPGCIRRLHDYLSTDVPYPARITVADNASTDGTLAVAFQLAEELHDVDVVHLDIKGRGGALQAAWMSSPAEVVVYMDVDLSTELSALMPLVAPLLSGHSDLAIGSRMTASSRVVRGPKREFVSRSYNLMLRGLLGARFSDAQCGFKAVRADVARRLLPLVADTGWFFDTELLVIAERVGLRIHEVPVDWIDDPDSRVDIVATAISDLKGCGGSRGHWPPARCRSANCGTAWAANRWFPVCREGWSVNSCGSAWSVWPAHWPTRCCTLRCMRRSARRPRTWPHCCSPRSATPRPIVCSRSAIRGRAGAARHQLHGLIVFAFGLAITSGSLFFLHRFDPTVGKVVELSVLVLANLVATLIRFVALRRVFGVHVSN